MSNLNDMRRRARFVSNDSVCSSDSQSDSEPESLESLEESFDGIDVTPHLSPEFVDFGLLFDVDGVIARGSNPLDPAKRMIHMLKNDHGEVQVPIAFVTNACNPSAKKAKQISDWLGVEVRPDQVMHAQSPLKVFSRYHDKHVLVVGQGPLKEMADDLGFTNICTIEDVKESFPLLDMVDHANRIQIAKNGFVEKDFPRIEAVVIFGEPNRWETNLQLLVDLLLTNGWPKMAPEGMGPETQLPIIACNMDLVFMAEACMPRFGNGSFLICLESLYKKITGKDLQYSALVGKPSEITMRYAEHTIGNQAKRLGLKTPVKRLYFFGDNPEVDIVGANLYHRYINTIRCNGNEETSSGRNSPTSIPTQSRAIPDAKFNEQVAESCEGILVCTGVYNPNTVNLDETHIYHHGHRDFERDPELKKPKKIVENVFEGVQYVLEKEGFKIRSGSVSG